MASEYNWNDFDWDNMSDDLEGEEILSHLSIDYFILGDDSDYDSIREMRALLQK